MTNHNKLTRILVRCAPSVVASALATSCLLAASASAANADAATPLSGRNTHGGASASTTHNLPFRVWTRFVVAETGSVSDVFTFYSRTPVLIRVTDALCRGDALRVLDRGF